MVGKLADKRRNGFIASKENAGNERWRHSSARCKRLQALAGEKRTKMLGERDRERKLHDTSTDSSRTALAGKTEKRRIFFKGL